MAISGESDPGGSEGSGRGRSANAPSTATTTAKIRAFISLPRGARSIAEGRCFWQQLPCYQSVSPAGAIQLVPRCYWEQPPLARILDVEARNVLRHLIHGVDRGLGAIRALLL